MHWFTKHVLSGESIVSRNSAGFGGSGSNWSESPRCSRRATLLFQYDRAGPAKSVFARRKFSEPRRLSAKSVKITILELGENLVRAISGTPVTITHTNNNQNTN